MTSKPRDPYGWLTVTDLQLVARARGVDFPASADRDEMVAVLRSQDGHPSAPDPSPTAPVVSERSGWWTSMSVSALRTVARAHGIDVPAGMRRHELIALVIEQDVPRPSGVTSGRWHRSR
jgi:hypothetical protein